MLNNTGITIIVPFYNTESYIEECLASIFSQSFVERGGLLCVICVDDGSTDDTAAAVLKMFEFASGVDCRIVNHDKNRGLATARNTGLRLVNTKYVIFLDSDDMLSPTSLEKLHFEMEGREADVGIFEYQYFSPSGSFYQRNYSSRLFGDSSFAIEAVEHNLAVTHALSACNKIYRSSFLGQAIFPEKRSYSEDIEFWFEILAQRPKTIFIAGALYHYRKREDLGSRSIIDGRDSTIANYFEYLDILDKLRLKYQLSDPSLWSSIAWFSQKSLLYYLARSLNLPTARPERYRARFTAAARAYMLEIDVDHRLPTYQAAVLNVLRSKMWPFIHLLGYLHKVKLSILGFMSKVSTFEFSTIKRVYGFFSAVYLKELPRIVRYLLVTRAQDNDPDVWMMGERGGDAGDNALALFRSLNAQTDFKKQVFYVCAGEAYNKLKASSANIILYGSGRHYRVFVNAGRLISTHSRGNIEPFKNKFLLSLLSQNYNAKKYVFLGHGVTKDDMSQMLGNWNYANAHFDLVWCGSKMEYRDVVSRYGYPRSKVTCAPLPRWQWPLYEDCINEESSPVTKFNVMIMFTWRSDFGRNLRKLHSVRERFEKNYLDPIAALLEHPKLVELSEVKCVKFHLVLHPETEITLKHYNLALPDVETIQHHEPSDISRLVRDCDLLVTDYSSIAFDFAYFGKPTVYYQFDADRFRKSHYQQGYFNYQIHGFGPICESADHCAELVDETLHKQPEYLEMRRHLHFQHDIRIRGDMALLRDPVL